MKLIYVAVGVSYLLMNLSPLSGLITEIPVRSVEELMDLASNVVIGTVERVYECRQEKRQFEIVYYVAEVSVQHVDKGDAIAVRERVFVRYWKKKWTGNGTPPPGHYGHRTVINEGDVVKLFLSGDRNAGYDVVSPNGFNVVKESR